MQMQDAKKKAIEELMAHLDMKDGEELGAAIKPKEDPATPIEAEKPEGIEPDGDEAPGIAEGDDSDSKMSPEEMEELIEAIQSKLGG